MKFLILLGLFAPFTGAHASFTTPEDAHQQIKLCLDRFENLVQVNLRQVQTDLDQSRAESREAKERIHNRFFILNLGGAIYDRFAKGVYDWEHPDREKTDHGKARAYGLRSSLDQSRINQLNEILESRPRIRDDFDLLMVDLKSMKKSLNWLTARTNLRNNERVYYDVMGDEMREMVYENGWANEVDWNKTMGEVQETFFRNISCVTLLDQIKASLPARFIEDEPSRLVDHVQSPIDLMKKRISDMKSQDID